MESNSIHTLHLYFSHFLIFSCTHTVSCRTNISEPPLVWHWTRLGNVFEPDKRMGARLFCRRTTSTSTSTSTSSSALEVGARKERAEQSRTSCRWWLTKDRARHPVCAEETWQMHRMTWWHDRWFVTAAGNARDDDDVPRSMSWSNN